MFNRAVLTSVVALTSFGIPMAHAQTAPADQAESKPAAEPNDIIIITGTRQTGITAAESVAPIKLVSDEAIASVAQPNLNQVLAQLVPSFRAPGFGADAANLTLSGTLRGLNPNHTLVLVNGKRRHGSANLQVQSSPTQGGAAPDLDFISPGSIDHIEVLEDGAAAQYGSDAVAGVINIILKKGEGGSFSGSVGQNYTRGGRTYSGNLNYGWLFDQGHLNLTAFYRDNASTRQGDQDIRAADLNGDAPASHTGIYLSDIQGAEYYPYVTPAYGRADSQFGVVSFDGAYNLTDGVELYSFGSLGFRKAESNAYYRTPNTVVAAGPTWTGGVSIPTYNSIAATDPSRIFARNGFVPILAFDEKDTAITSGLRGEATDWRWDISTTWGEDHIDAETRNTVNADLFVEQGSRQTDFYDGSFKATEWTTNLDVSREFNEMATLALGLEYRENDYEISAGEPASYYKSGASAYPGFSPVAAGHHDRNSYAGYADLALTPIENLKVDAAVRYEKFSDFGDTTNWKLSGRYDFSPEVALRGTVSTGFRAPTLAEAYYTQVGVGPTSANVNLAANSAAAKILGIQDLEPEESSSFSTGIVLRPIPEATITIDAYEIKLSDRIVGTAKIVAKTASFDANDLVWQSIVASGFGVGNVPFVAVSSFANGPSTRTRGVDVTASYDADFDNWGSANFTLSGAYTDTKITRAAQTPAPVLAYGSSISDGQSDSALTTVTPKLKLIAGVNWKLGDFALNLRETYYTDSVAYINNGSGLNRTQVDATGITDIEFSYRVTPDAKISVGAQNLFDKRPNGVVPVPGGLSDGGAVLHAPLVYGPYGIDGGYWFGKLDVAF